MDVLDLGAGRGASNEVQSTFVRGLLDLRGKARRVIGVDLDPVVLTNPLLDEAHVYDGVRIPLPDSSIDLIVSDNTLEHVTSPSVFAREIARVLKPGGWLCARTPHLYSALVIASSLVPNTMHSRCAQGRPVARSAGGRYFPHRLQTEHKARPQTIFLNIGFRSLQLYLVARARLPHEQPRGVRPLACLSIFEAAAPGGRGFACLYPEDRSRATFSRCGARESRTLKMARASA